MKYKLFAIFSVSLALLIICTSIESVENPSGIFGFSSNNVAEQIKTEQEFDTFLADAPYREWMKQLTARPHHAGSEHGRKNAEWMLQLFKSWGYEAQIESFPFLLPIPKIRKLELLSPESYVAKLSEPLLSDSDKNLRTPAEELPPFAAYTVGGDATGELVYVNYGMPADFKELVKRGIDVIGKITIAKFGGGWRGIAPRESAKNGAIGCIMYMDPADYGWNYGDPYPKGGVYNGWAVERGSISDFTKFAGDPLTVGTGSTSSLQLPSPEEIKRLPGLIPIPVLPIGWNDAQPLLEAIDGQIAPIEWKGGLPFPYHLGPGPAKVRLQVEFDWKLVPTYNVIAKLPGATEPDQWVIRGNHHDAWVYGAGDPTSAMVAMLAEARAIGKLAANGWRPKRTMIYAAWDGEEVGLRGSVEWAETHAAELQRKAVAYLNTDGYTRGYLQANGSPILELVVNQVARDVQDPVKQVPVLKRHLAAQIVHGGPQKANEAREKGVMRLGPASGGSDHVPFLHHLGIPSVFVLYSGDENSELSHTSYDHAESYERYMDPDFRYGITMAQTNGRIATRFASADVIPYDPVSFADSMERSVRMLSARIEELRSETDEHNRRIEEGIFVLTSNPDLPFRQPEKLNAVPEFDLTALTRANERLRIAADDYRKLVDRAISIPEQDRKNLNFILMQLESSLLRPEGLPERPWFRHQIWAPGINSGYSGLAFPGLNEALANRDWNMAQQQIPVVADTLNRFTATLQQAINLLQ